MKERLLFAIDLVCVKYFSHHMRQETKDFSPLIRFTVLEHISMLALQVARLWT